MVDELPHIRIREGGPYVATGVNIHRKHIEYSEHGEPLTYRSDPPLDDGASTVLCRCGASANKPYCDQAHRDLDWDPETADCGNYDERSKALEGSTGLTVRDDRSICVHAGFCGTRVSNVWKMASETDESTVRLAVINMVEKCPSGALTYRFDGSDDDVEPEYATGVSILDDGPLWVHGGVTVELPDGSVIETRNRVTLCRCGASSNKPLCDGSHKEAGFSDRG
jgi:CDGSH-type Zn-finger protein